MNNFSFDLFRYFFVTFNHAQAANDLVLVVRNVIGRHRVTALAGRLVVAIDAAAFRRLVALVRFAAWRLWRRVRHNKRLGGCRFDGFRRENLCAVRRSVIVL